MKRRSFLAALTAIAAAPKALLAKIPTESWRPGTTLAGHGPYDTLGPGPKEVCRRFAARYKLKLFISHEENIAFFEVPLPRSASGSARWATTLSSPAQFELERQLKYQLAKKLQEIEQYTGLRGFPPGGYRGVASIAESGYIPAPQGKYSNNWSWDRIRA